ncbi:beta-hydroxyacyl-ACP dehydratase [bacterium]|nr:beta-hydroxyacyl-ACP dehydratase [bacterium]
MRELDRYIGFLPQKPPFLFLDAIDQLIHMKTASGRKMFPVGDRVFENHLPGEPLVPGVILIEALAQLSGIVLIPEDGLPVHGYLAGVDQMRFRRLVHPDEEIVLRATLERRFGSAARFEVQATVRGESAAAGALTLSTGDEESSRRRH